MHLRKRYVIAVLTLGIHAAPRAQELPRGVGAREVTLYAQLLAMTDTRRLDTALVDRALASNWAPMRAVATLAIGQVGAGPGMPGASRLRTLLRDRDVTVAANAAYALGLLRDSAATADLSAALALDHRVGKRRGRSVRSVRLLAAQSPPDSKPTANTIQRSNSCSPRRSSAPHLLPRYAHIWERAIPRSCGRRPTRLRVPGRPEVCAI
jgi:hypothetical protein